MAAAANGEQAARKLKSRLAAIAMRRLGLRYISTDELTIRRKRIGDRFSFVSRRGRTIRDELTRARLKRLAVPPPYRRRGALRHRSARAHPGDRARCGGSPAIPLSFRVGAGARAAQGHDGCGGWSKPCRASGAP